MNDTPPRGNGLDLAGAWERAEFRDLWRQLTPAQQRKVKALMLRLRLRQLARVQVPKDEYLN